MKDIMCAAMAGVVLAGCMNNETSSSTAPVAVASADVQLSKSADFDQADGEFIPDERTVRSIRRSFAHNKSVPTNGKDVRLIITDKRITLRGVVKSEKERVSIGALARQFAGPKQIDNQLEVVDGADEGKPNKAGSLLAR